MLHDPHFCQVLQPIMHMVVERHVMIQSIDRQKISSSERVEPFISYPIDYR